MNILGVYGSSRKGGNTDQLLDSALEGAAFSGSEIRKVFARDLKISGCQACHACDETGKCIVDDEMRTIYPLFDWADVIFLASPIYFYGLSGQVKLVIDRGQAMWARRMLEKDSEARKRYDRGKGYLIAVGATHGKNLFKGSELTARYFFEALDKSYQGGIFFRSLEKISAVKGSPETLQEAYNLGRKAVSS